MNQVRNHVERIFGPDYLFDPVRDSWRSIVCPEFDATPPFIPLSNLMSFVDISSAVNGDEDALASALLSSQIVEVKQDSSCWMIRRRNPLKLADDPEKRTVFVKPIHYDASEGAIRAFFQRFGPIDKVDRRVFIDGGVAKPRPSVFIVFASVEGANACIASKVSYGSCGNELGDLFLPRITCVSKSAHEAQVAEETEREHDQRYKAAVVKGAAPSGETGSKTNKYLRPGCTLKVTGVNPKTTWSEIKAKLGNLGEFHPELRQQIVLVRVVANGVAYVVCKSPKAATDFTVAFATSKDPGLTAIVPTLSLLTGEEEGKVIAEFPTWTAAKVQKKQQLNERTAAKRAREE